VTTRQPPRPGALARNLQRQRFTRGWTLRQAAIQAGVSPMTIRRAERGADITVRRAALLAAAYGVTLDTLLTTDLEAS